MTSIRQRRRNRHRAKSVSPRVERPIVLILNIDVAKVNKALNQVSDAMARWRIPPEFQKIAAELAKVAFPPLNVIQEVISTQRSAQNHLYDAWRYQEACRHKTLGDPSCKFNARSQYIQCAVNPSGNCVTCRHYEEVL